MMAMTMAALQVMMAAALAAEVPKEPASDLSLHRVTVTGLEVRFVDYHWHPELFAAMEAGSREVAEARRDWVLARVAVEPDPLKFEGVALRPGSYALSLFPSQKGEPMALELRRVDIREAYPSLNVMAPAPEGKTMYREPARFEMASPPSPRLDITLAEEASAIVMTVRYGNRRLALKLAR